MYLCLFHTSALLGAMEPTDILSMIRWRGKKDSSQVAKSYVKGKVIDGEHELYTLSIAVMIGVRTSVSNTNNLIAGHSDAHGDNARKSRHRSADKSFESRDRVRSRTSSDSALSSNSEVDRKASLSTKGCLKGKRWVQKSDFFMTEKYEFRPRGGKNTPPHQLAHTFKFKDYAPVVFAYLRRLAGINEYDFLLSVCGNANFIEFISNAKSGQFFFYSSDGKYMVKTMTNAESKFIRRSKCTEYWLFLLVFGME
jgi:1-phosphatidylinositol-4-phosphate 5-kinase